MVFLAEIKNPSKPLSFTLKYISCPERKFEIQKKSYYAHSTGQWEIKSPPRYFLIVYNLLTISLIAGLGPQGGHVPGQAPDPEVQAQHADQQGAHAQIGGRESLQVSFKFSFALYILQRRCKP